MKLNIFAILLISLSACEKNCTITPTNSSTQSNTNTNTNNSTKEQFVLDNQAKLTKFLGNSDSLNTAFTTLKNSSDKNEKKQALSQIKKAIDDYVMPGYADFPALHQAVFTGNKEILEILLESGADIDLKNREGKTALNFASSTNDSHTKDIIEFLLNKGADASIKDNQGKTALDVALKPEVKALLQAKTKPVVENNNPKPVAVENNGANANNNKPIAVENNNPAPNANDKPVAVENNGANANDKPVKEQFVLDNQSKLTKFLGNIGSLNKAFTTLKNSSDKNEKEQALSQIKKAIDDYVMPGYADFPALHQAVFTGNKEILEILLESGADIDLKNREGKTALNFASSTNDSHAKDIVEFLLDKGADASIKDNQGKTALDVAFKPEVKALLQAKTKPVVENNNPKPVAVENNGANANHNSLPISAEEIKNHEEILSDPDTQKFIDLLKFSAEEILREIDFNNDNNITDVDAYRQRWKKLIKEKEDLDAKKTYLKELLANMLEKAQKRNYQNIFHTLDNDVLLKAARNNEKIKTNLLTYIEKLSKENIYEVKSIINRNFMTNISNKDITLEILTKILNKNDLEIDKLGIKELFNDLCGQTSWAKDILTLIIEKTNPTLSASRIDLVNKDNFNKIINSGIDKDLIYQSIREDNEFLQKSIIKNQTDKLLLTELLTRFNKLNIDTDILNHFGDNNKIDLLKFFWNKADKNKIAYNDINDSTLKNMISFIKDDNDKKNLINKLNDQNKAVAIAHEIYLKIDDLTKDKTMQEQVDLEVSENKRNEFLTNNLTKDNIEDILKKYNNPSKKHIGEKLSAKEYKDEYKYENAVKVKKAKYEQILEWLK